MKNLLAFLLFGIFLTLSNADEIPPMGEHPDEPIPPMPDMPVETVSSEIEPADIHPGELPEILTGVIEAPPAEFIVPLPADEIPPMEEHPEEPIPPMPDMPPTLEEVKDETEASEELHEVDDMIDVILTPMDPEEPVEEIPLLGSVPEMIEHGMPEVAVPGGGDEHYMPTEMEDMHVTTKMPEHEMTDEMKVAFGLTDCGTVDETTCNKKSEMKVWTCEFSKFLRETGDWVAEFMDWWNTCENRDDLNPEYIKIECSDQSGIHCRNADQRNCIFIEGCETCRCLDGDYVDANQLKKMWRMQMDSHRRRLMRYRETKDSCVKSECMDGRVNPDDADDMGSGSGEGSGMDSWYG